MSDSNIARASSGSSRCAALELRRDKDSQHQVTNFSVHDIALVDSPAFHFTMDTCTNGEVYNLIIRGADRGGLDGVDIWSTNIWVHDVEVTNRDEW